MLVLLRHGEATANASGLLLGRSDAPLTDKGRLQALRLAPNLKNVNRLISSPLKRARETAAELSLAPPCEVDPRWIEIDYGEYEGEKLGDVPAEVWQKWREDPEFTPPGGESLANVGRRVREVCEELFANDGSPARSKDGDVVVVSHVSPIKAAVAWALGVGDHVVWHLFLSTGSMTQISWGAGFPVLQSFNVSPEALVQ